VGATIGTVLSFPFGDMLLSFASENLLIDRDGNVILNIVSGIAVAIITVFFSLSCTRKIRKLTPIGAIRGGTNGERFTPKTIFRLSRTKLSPIPFMSVNDIFSNIRRFFAMIITFTLGVLLIIIPVNTLSTVNSGSMSEWLGYPPNEFTVKSDINLEELKNSKYYKDSIITEIENYRNTISENGMVTEDFEISESVFSAITLKHNELNAKPFAIQCLGDVKAGDFEYLKGSPPENVGEIAITKHVSNTLKAYIGDTITADLGYGKNNFLVTGYFQCMNSPPGNVVRFNENELISSALVVDTMDVQISFNDNAGKKDTEKRFEKLKEIFPENKVMLSSDLISSVVGNMGDYINSSKNIIILIVVLVNMLMATLMVNTFISEEKKDIATLKAIGFSDNSLIIWQSLRIGFVFILSSILGILLSEPSGHISVGAVFRSMGLEKLTFHTDPLQVYVLLPLMIFIATSIAAFLSAQTLRKISANEVNTIE
jgi:putative ABC transport system permease protein